MRTSKNLLSVGIVIPALRRTKVAPSGAQSGWPFLAEATAVVTFPLANAAKSIVFFTAITKAARWQTTQAARTQLGFACLNIALPHCHSEGTPQEDAIDTRLAFRFQNAGWNRPALHSFDEQANNIRHQVHRATVVATVAAEELRSKEL